MEFNVATKNHNKFYSQWFELSENSFSATQIVEIIRNVNFYIGFKKYG